ncbi:hypothetical protein BOKEGFJH_00054 [Chlamydia avium]|uniref:Uroporphyrinogen-III synthase HemD family protein n=1 Tax=Chlamydia avium TaxID=1457141 RepID=A0ABP2X720_9CHLA|nr:uroporphyrinogen-III synthase [Chlamydia avium]EPP37782.1 uroporphyrinogen-III synthase HemD family protein [Chlamydia psittaci 10_743_SC13]EPP38623.1 uroporphyrinogen-III synthase HemD family protein [Chlamydia avium]VVT42545.1 hypothetical protein BOKEGFJH_00054 [Chlamydia avium]
MHPQIYRRFCETKTAYLGLNSQTAKQYHADYIPILKLVPYAKSSPQIRQATHYLKRTSHIVLSSPSSTSLFFARMKKHKQYLRNLHYLCIGKVTLKRLLDFLPRAHYSLATTETSEGFLPLILPLTDNTRILYPHSSFSRPVITDFLTRENKQFFAYSHYTVRPRDLDPSIFSPYKNIIFTSPSGVRAYTKLFSRFPNKIYWCLGPITLQEFQKTSSSQVYLLTNADRDKAPEKKI